VEQIHHRFDLFDHDAPEGSARVYGSSWGQKSLCQFQICFLRGKQKKFEAWGSSKRRLGQTLPVPAPIDSKGPILSSHLHTNNSIGCACSRFLHGGSTYVCRPRNCAQSKVIGTPPRGDIVSFLHSHMNDTPLTSCCIAKVR
jgi:hypothetical protein